MKVFVDANILIAVLNREYPLYTFAARLLSLSNKKGIQLFTSPLCIAIAFYFSTKKSGEAVAKNKIELLAEHINLTSPGPDCVKQALKNPQVQDVEDGMEYYSALQEGCSYFITENREDFYFSQIKVSGCEEFLRTDLSKNKYKIIV